MFSVICDSCSENRYCPNKSEFNRKTLFGHAKGEQITCADFKPRWWRGVEGVAV